MAGSRTLKLSILADVDDLKKKLDTGSKDVEGFGGKLEKFGKVAAAAFAAAAAAAAAYAVKLAVDGVKAAIEDEAAQLRLANALKNVTNATDDQIASVEKQITKLSLANGIADDKLRPAFQRLATATGDLGRASDALTLALDISAATGKDVEAVSNALGKAYEGNTTALARLGIGMSTAEIKTLGLDGTMQQLAETFGGAATVQANTLEGQIARLKVGFDEAKESVGAALLPIIQKLMDYIVNTFIPMLQKAKAAAVDPIITAFKNNEEAMRDLWNFIKTYLVPIFEGALVNAIKAVGSTIAGIINIIGSVVNGIKSLVNSAIDAINAVINAYNRIPILPDVKTIPKLASSSSSGSSGTVGGVTLPFGGGSVVGNPITSGPTTPAVTTVTTTTGGITPITTTTKSGTQDTTTANVTPTMPTLGISSLIGGRFTGPGVSLDPEMVGPRVTVNVNSPSIIDQNGFTAAVVDAFNQVQARTGGGASRLVAL